MDALILIVILVLLVLSATFSGSETAFTASSRAFIARQSKEGNRNAARIAKLGKRKDRFIAALLVGNNFVNTTATALASGLLIAWFGEGGVLYASLVMTVLLVIFAEVLPKTYALQRPDDAALKAAPFLALVDRVLGPLGSLVNIILSRLLRAIGGAPDAGAGQGEEELQGLIDLYGIEEKGAAQRAAREERQMLRGVLALDDLTVEDVMTQRMRIVGLPADLDPDEIVSRLLSAGHSRLVLWGETNDDVVGIVDAKVALAAFAEARRDGRSADIRAFATPPVFVPESRPLREQLESFRNGSSQKMNLVVDEHGDLAGLVTLEDIVEVVFGQIAQPGEAIIADPKDSGHVTVRGDTRLREIERALEWDLPEREAATVGGLIVSERGGVPEVGTAIEIDGYRFKILERHGRRISSVEIRRLPRAVADPE